MQLLVIIVIGFAITIIDPINALVSQSVPAQVITTSDQLFNCTSYKTNFCVGLKNNTVSINDEGCILDRDCDVIVHAFRSSENFTLHFGCSTSDCQVIFLVYYNVKIELDRYNPIDTFDEAKQSIPNATPFAEADLRPGKESLTYYVKTFRYFTQLNGRHGLRGDNKLDMKQLRTTTSKGQKTSYKIGSRVEGTKTGYDWDKEEYSFVVIHVIDGKVINIVDGVEPMLLFDEKTKTIFEEKHVTQFGISMIPSQLVTLTTIFLSVTYHLIN